MEADGGGAEAWLVGGLLLAMISATRVGLPVAGADLEDGADHGADHVVEEAGAFDGEDHQGIGGVVSAAVDVAVRRFCGRCFRGRRVCSFEGVEVVFADVVGAGGLHGGEVEGAVEVVDVVAVEEGAVFVIPDQVAVAFVLGGADVENRSGGETSSRVRMRMSGGGRS